MLAPKFVFGNTGMVDGNGTEDLVRGLGGGGISECSCFVFKFWIGWYEFEEFELCVAAECLLGGRGAANVGALWIIEEVN